MMTVIGDYITHLEQCGRSPRTVTLRRTILRRMDSDLPDGLINATPDQLRAWIYRPHWSRSTWHAYHGCASAFFIWATNPWSPRVSRNPMLALPAPAKPRGVPKPITDRQLAAILDLVEPRVRLWSLLAAYAGLRCIEISRLHREHIDEHILIVLGKGEKAGVVPTHPLVWEAVRDLPAGPVARTLAGGPTTANYVSLVAIRAFAAAGLDGVHLHRLRHWFGTTVYRATRDIRRTQELLRHASPTTTALYTLISDEEREMAIRALPTFTAS